VTSHLHRHWLVHGVLVIVLGYFMGHEGWLVVVLVLGIENLLFFRPLLLLLQLFLSPMITTPTRTTRPKYSLGRNRFAVLDKHCRSQTLVRYRKVLAL